MKSKTLFLALILMLTVGCQFAARRASATDDGDMTPTNTAQWWWKYVNQYDPEPCPWKSLRASDVFVNKEIVNARTEEATNAVTFTFKNITAQIFECDGSVRITHTILSKSGSRLYSEIMARALLPAAIKPGESFQIRGTANTSSKYRGSTHVLEVEYLAK